jgi:hypothetical protein
MLLNSLNSRSYRAALLLRAANIEEPAVRIGLGTCRLLHVLGQLARMRLRHVYVEHRLVDPLVVPATSATATDSRRTARRAIAPVTSWILEWGPHVKVLEPANARDRAD